MLRRFRTPEEGRLGGSQGKNTIHAQTRRKVVCYVRVVNLGRPSLALRTYHATTSPSTVPKNKWVACHLACVPSGHPAAA